METVPMDQNPEAELGVVTPNLAPETDAERKAVECFAALEVGEREFRPGMEFGEAMIELRTEIKARGERNFMARLKQLGITYEKARYWIAVVEGKPTQRGKPKASAQALASALAQEPDSEWRATVARLREAIDEIDLLRRGGEAVGDDTELKEAARDLAEILGCELMDKGADNESNLLQRVRYYNEYDRSAAAWLRELITEGLIAPGVVDERSIKDVSPNDLRGFDQCHFFAGIGGWSRALRLAGWPDDKPVWTGSCPCQSFSNAGARRGFDDPRHLWPEFFPLIKECRPPTLFGEQVAGAIGFGWLDQVAGDLESADYAVGAAVFPAACVGAPHERDRLYFVADSDRLQFPPDSPEWGVGLLEAAWSLVSGLMPSGFRAQAGKGVLLNPEFVLWLMGFPATWVSCGERAMRSCRSKRPSS